MFIFCGQIQAGVMTNGIVKLTFLTEAKGEVISRIVLTQHEAAELRDLLARILEKEIKH